MIPESGFVTTMDGEPHPGVVLSPAGAKEIAYVLLLLAQQLENGTMPAPPPPTAPAGNGRGEGATDEEHGNCPKW
jgi:hypothetical protein